jgi:hypothetical protein
LNIQIEARILKRLLYPFNFREACLGITKINASDYVGGHKDVNATKLKNSMLLYPRGARQLSYKNPGRSNEPNKTILFMFLNKKYLKEMAHSEPAKHHHTDRKSKEKMFCLNRFLKTIEKAIDQSWNACDQPRWCFQRTE